jgi:hypothetical protein
MVFAGASGGSPAARSVKILLFKFPILPHYPLPSPPQIKGLKKIVNG